MEKVKNAINWFEIPVTNFSRAKKFYSDIFDYEMPEQQMDDMLMGFFPCDMEKGGVGGAIAKTEEMTPAYRGVMVYLNGGDDLNVVLKRVPDAGGEVATPKTKISDEIGFYGVFIDPEGNKVSLHSPH